jgi:tricarballylate dehydrogenase
LPYDVLVVGAGNAAMCAALAAEEAGASVLVIERAPRDQRGGNTAFTAGSMRVAYRGVEDIQALVPDLSPEQLAITDFGHYTVEQFFDDLGRVTEYRTDPDLAHALALDSFETLLWMRSKGVRFVPIYGRQAFRENGRFTFWGGLTVEAVGGGPGLVEALTVALERRDVQIDYGARLVSLIADDTGVHGARVKSEGRTREIEASTVVLASGGFQANREWRARYLGANWDLAKVRGTQFNTGDGIRAALEIDAMPWGHWSSCHAVGWDRNAPDFGDLAVGDGFQKHSYPFSIMVNTLGKRFLDEGADFRNYTYAKYGSVILQQPEQYAWQIFDAQTSHLLRDEYRIRQVTRVKADTLEELVARMELADPAECLRTIHEYNQAVQIDVPFNPNVKDGRGTTGLAVPKTNWANRIETGPFEAYAVTCGITFTFGGIRITPQGQVIDTDHKPIPGLYAAGEIVGGIFYFNYPGGAGLTAGSVFGRRSGTAAALAASRRHQIHGTEVGPHQ